MVRSSIGGSARANLPLKDAEIVGVDCSTGSQTVQWSELREGYPVSFVKTDASANALRIEFPVSVTGGVGGQFYEISDPDGAVEFAVVDGEIRRLDDNLLPAAWSDIAKGLVQKATNAEAAVDALLPWGSGTALNEDLGMTPALTRVLVEENYLIRNSITYSVGPSGSADFVDLNEAFEFLDGKTLASGANVYLALEPGRILHTKSIVINHPQALRIHIQGAPMLGAVPTKDDFTGDQTLDLAMLRSRFGSEIEIASGAGIWGMLIETNTGLMQDFLMTSNPGSTDFSAGMSLGYNAGNVRVSTATLLNICVHGFKGFGYLAVSCSTIQALGSIIASH